MTSLVFLQREISVHIKGLICVVCASHFNRAQRRSWSAYDEMNVMSDYIHSGV